MRKPFYFFIDIYGKFIYTIQKRKSISLGKRAVGGRGPSEKIPHGFGQEKA